MLRGYQDTAAATARGGTWGRYAGQFLAAADIPRFVVFDRLTAAVAERNAVYMDPFSGFAR